MGYVQSSGGFTINVTGALSGTAGEVAYFDSVNSVTSSPNFTWNGTVLGVTGTVTASVVVKAGDGTVGAPAFSFIAAPTMGIYRTGSASWAISSANNWVAQWDATGNLVKGSETAPLKIVSAEGNSSWLSIYHDTSADAVLNNTFATGNVLIGSNAVTALTVTSVGNTIGIFRKDQNAKTAIAITNANAGASANAELRITNDTDDFRILVDSSGGGNIANILANSGLSGLNLATLGSDPVTIKSNNTLGITLDAVQNIALGSAAIATNATDGFLYIVSCAGTPTGVPTTYTGRTPMVYDTTNDKFYIYRGGWKGVTLS